MAASDEILTAPDRLVGSQDKETGQVYFPARVLTADGSLRSCERVELSPTGVLYTFTKFAGKFFGQVDLPEGVRIQSLLEGDDHRIGATYKLVVETDEGGKQKWRFRRD